MVAIVSHDAGGAEILSSWIKTQNESYCLVLGGPALKIFERKLGSIVNLSLDSAIIKADWILCGTSWQSNLERNAIIIAKERGKRIISFIDHWVYYAERFNFNGTLVLPDEIWVGDKFAEDLARSIFPDMPIFLMTNPYFEDLKFEIKKYEFFKHLDCNNLLYVCEPLKEQAYLEHGDEMFFGYTEEDALVFFLKNIPFLKSPVNKIRIRPHPSEKPSKYSWCLQNDHINLEISEGTTLLEDMEDVNIVVGCESMAMVVGLLAGKRVVCSIPPGGKICELPYPEIEHLQELIIEKVKKA
jgi:hypothetical protein